MRFLPSLGIRSRMLLLVVLPAVLILAAVLTVNYLRMRSLLLSLGEEILRDRVEVVAAEIDRGFAGQDSATASSAVEQIAADLREIKRRQADRDWHAELFLLGRDDAEAPAEPRVIASTFATEDLRGRPISQTPFAAILEQLREPVGRGRLIEAADPITGEARLFAAARVPSGDRTVVMAIPRSDIVGRIQGPLLASAGLGIAGLAGVLGLLGWLTSRFTGRIDTAVAAARRVAQGDLTGTIASTGGDETGQLLRDVGGMTASLREIVSQVKRASFELNATARQLSAAGRQQETAIESLGTSTNEAAVASRQIAATGRELLGTMEDVAGVAADTARVADQGREGLAEVGQTMESLERSTADFADRLAAIRQRAEDITMVITTITKVADQTNLLSINAAIEAEKAGQYGQGFLVVAREIRRLADQTAVATLDIERLVEQMQEAVNAGVGQMERFAADVTDGVERVTGISGQFAAVIDKVRSLSDRFETVTQGMQAQAAGAGQISEALVTLTDGTRAAADALEEFQEASGQMVAAVDGLTDTVARFRVDE